MAKPSIEAEESRETGAQVRVPRYAAYSVWVCYCRERNSAILLSLTVPVAAAEDSKA